MNDPLAAMRNIAPGDHATHPIARLMGWRCVSVDREKGEMVVSYQARPEFANPVGMVQGGMLSAMLDDVMSPAATLGLAAGEAVQTLEMKTSYFSPAKIGTIIARGWVRRRGRDILFLEAQLEGEDGKLIATASATARRFVLPTRAA
jgi:uncharacterized protein (TIGR00369 family)